MKNGVFFANKNKFTSSKRNMMWSNHLLQQTKLN
jgi:hypothetical protein